MPGRPPTPIATHKKRGTYRKDRHAGKAEVPDESIGAVPDWFESVTAIEWAALTLKKKAGRKKKADADESIPSWFAALLPGEWARLAALPHVKDAHATVVKHACILYARMVQDAMGLRNMMASERQCLHSIYMQLGCTPASQSKVAAPPVTKADDQWAQLG